MDKDYFLEKCSTIGVESIVPIEETSDDDGFKVIFKDGSSIYVLFRNEYGDAWMEYETEEHFKDRWSNIHTLTGEELEEFNKKVFKSIEEKYSTPNFQLFMNTF